MKQSLFDEAYDALVETFTASGAHVFEYPTIEHSWEEGNYVYLANHHETLGIYDIEEGKLVNEEEDE